MRKERIDARERAVMTGFERAKGFLLFVLGIRREFRLRRLARQALDWRERLRRNDEGVNSGFAGWLIRSPDHVQVWLELTAFDEEVAQLLRYPAFGAIVASAPESCLPCTEKDAAPVLRQGAKGLRWGLAAAAMLALIAVALLRGPPEFVTKIGQHHRFFLDDGSVVDLNTQSHILVRFSETQRVVELLQGEALFDVAHDSQRPFRVVSGGRQIEDVGTRFGVRKYSRGLAVVVAEGRVSVSGVTDGGPASGAAAATIDLGAGDAVEIQADAPAAISRLDAAAVGRRLSWVNGVLQFENDSLLEIVNEMNRYDTRELVIASPELAKLRLGGKFRPTDPLGFGQALERMGICRVVVDRNGVIHLVASRAGRTVQR
jgi:transmembrane sensor